MGTGSALVDEFCRAGELQPHFFRRCQREFRDFVLPALAFVDEHGGVEGLAAIIMERERLREELSARSKSAKLTKSETADVA